MWYSVTAIILKLISGRSGENADYCNVLYFLGGLTSTCGAALMRALAPVECVIQTLRGPTQNKTLYSTAIDQETPQGTTESLVMPVAYLLTAIKAVILN